ncbi:MAG: hypothetical protein RLZZ175_1220 [Bacteroidota bacterium]|jgi:hypothetical protein
MKKIFTILLFALCSTWAIGQNDLNLKMELYAGKGVGGIDGPVNLDLNTPCIGGQCVEGNDGNIYCTSSNGKILKIDQENNVTTFSQCIYPVIKNIASDSYGNFYVTVPDYNRILKINSKGEISNFAGNGNYGDKDGNANVAEFKYPLGIVVDKLGNVYVADNGNNKIKKITSQGLVSTYAGTGIAGNINSISLSSEFYYPRQITINETGDLFITEYDKTNNNTNIRKIGTNGIVTTLANINIDIYRSTILYSKGELFTTISANFNHSIVKVNLDGTLTSIAGHSCKIASKIDDKLANSTFDIPQLFIFNNTIHVSDQGVVRKIDIINNKVTTIVGSTNGTNEGTDLKGTAASFGYIGRIFVDKNGDVYILDQGNLKIRKITTGGNVITISGSSQCGFKDGIASEAQFSSLDGFVMDSKGNIFVADRNNLRIRKVTTDGTVTTFAGNGRNSTSTILNGTGTAARFDCPTDIAIDQFDNLYVSECDGKIRKITPMGQVSTYYYKLGEAYFSIECDTLGNVYAGISNGIITKFKNGNVVDGGNISLIKSKDFRIKPNGDAILYNYDSSPKDKFYTYISADNQISKYHVETSNNRYLAYTGYQFVDIYDGELYLPAGNELIKITNKTTSTCSTTVATQPSVTATKTAITAGESITLSVATGTLNCATAWKWYSGSCGGTLVGTGSSITVSPSFNTTYYVRGEGSSVASGTCGSLAISVNQAPYGFKVTKNGMAADGTSLANYSLAMFSDPYIPNGSTATISKPIVDNGAIKVSLSNVKLYNTSALKIIGLTPLTLNMDLSNTVNQKVAIKVKASVPVSFLIDFDDSLFASYFNYGPNRPTVNIVTAGEFKWYVFDLAGKFPRIPKAVSQVSIQYVSSTPFTGDIWIDEMLVGEFVPTITQTSSLSNFVTNVNTPSKAQSINISGTSLIDLINVNAPSGYEITTDTLGVWSSQLQVSGTNAKLFVRAKAQSASNSITGNLTLTSTAAVNVTIPLNGSVINGINDKLWSNQIKLIPNPVIDYLEISSEQKSISKYTIYSSLGEIVLSNSNWTETEKIDVRHLPSGIYIIKVSDYENAKIIKFVKH